VVKILIVGALHLYPLSVHGPASLISMYEFEQNFRLAYWANLGE
jgi:hypothetical protein